VCSTLIYLANRWFPSIGAARAADDRWIHEMARAGARSLAVLDSVVLVADSQAGRRDANLEVFEQVLDLLRYEGIDLAGVPFVFQLKKHELPGMLTVDELRETLATPRCAHVESVAVQSRGVLRALATLPDLVDHRTA